LNNFGSIYLSGNAALSGTLSVNFTNGCALAASNSFPLVSYSSETGTFTALNLPQLPSKLYWQTNYGNTTFSLNVSAVPTPSLSVPALRIGKTISITWAAMPGQMYQVQYTTTLFPANWINLGNPINATNATMSVPDDTSLNPQRFYRVVMP
jgi:hypothetical protein